LSMGDSSEALEKCPKLICPTCGDAIMRRLQRKIFLERVIYPLFGYFPWECPVCRKSRLLRTRHRRRSAYGAD